MKFSKLTLAVAGVLTASASFNAVAIELYVDTKTKQIYAEPGPHRQRLGKFEQVDEAKTPAPAAVESTNQEIKAIREELDLKTNEIKALEEHAKESEEVKVKIDDGIEFKSKDGNFKAAINGRIQVDSQNNVTDRQSTSNPNDHIVSDGASIRRARLGVEGTFYKDFDYKFEYDFTRGNGYIASGVTDAFLRWNLNKGFSIKAGSFKEPFSLEEATSNRYITFIERNMVVNAFVDNPNTYKTGFGANYSADRWQLGASIQTEPVGNWPANAGSTTASNGNNRGSSGGSGDSSWELNSRLSLLPWMESKTKFLHVGGSASHVHVNNNIVNNVPSANGGMGFYATLNGNVDRANILNTNNLSAADGSKQIESYDRFGGEIATVYGPWSAQAEYIQTDINGTGYSNNSLSGYYGYMTYFLTGESRAYKSKTGAWDRLKPNRNFDMKGGWGAWELAVGYDALDLSSGMVNGSRAINGGRAATAKFGVNWYPNSHFRLMGNFIHVLDLSTPTKYDKADLDMVEFRAQVDF
ncbi:MAG: porin [Methylococcaceae bacterium]